MGPAPQTTTGTSATARRPWPPGRGGGGLGGCCDGVPVSSQGAAALLCIRRPGAHNACLVLLLGPLSLLLAPLLVLPSVVLLLLLCTAVLHRARHWQKARTEARNASKSPWLQGKEYMF